MGRSEAAAEIAHLPERWAVLEQALAQMSAELRLQGDDPGTIGDDSGDGETGGGVNAEHTSGEWRASSAAS